MKVGELLDKEEKWCRGEYARDINGYSVDYNSEDACQWCLYGAIYKCYGTNKRDIISKITKRIWRSIGTFNDDPNTTFQDIRRVIRELDI